jgi:hypothetical protein
MAVLDDILKGNVLTSLAVGLGAVLLAPLAGQVLRPAAEAVIKSEMLRNGTAFGCLTFRLRIES